VLFQPAKVAATANAQQRGGNTLGGGVDARTHGMMVDKYSNQCDL
jgi:hypothetical protein